MSRWLAAFVVVTSFISPAVAEDDPFGGRPPGALGKSRVLVPTPPEKFTPHESVISPWLYLNRCTGGCVINFGNVNDARTNTSTIPMGTQTTFMISEFRDAAGNTGALADAEWNAIVQCMKEVYSPFALNVTDQRPTTGVSYTMGIIAGRSSEIGWSAGTMGVAPGGCQPQDNVISFSFANQHGNFDRVWNICWTAAQETAHAFGLDHEFQFSDGTSACSDPMTYRTDCGGQKFFRNKAAQCGEESARMCSCGGSQNSHVKIRAVFGDGVSLVPPPTVEIVAPVPGTPITNATAVAASAGSKRGVAKVELWINKFKWAEKPGALFGPSGQLNPSPYSIPLPAMVPDGNMDLVVKAYDDLGIMTESQTVMVVKGAPCTSASTCAKGQKCEAGYCLWDPPTGQLGDKCEYPQFCESMLCADALDGDDFCSQECIVGASDACPMGYTCESGSGATSGLCAPEDRGGCPCSTGGRSSAGGVAMMLSVLVLGLVLRRRRR